MVNYSILHCNATDVNGNQINAAVRITRYYPPPTWYYGKLTTPFTATLPVRPETEPSGESYRLEAYYGTQYQKKEIAFHTDEEVFPTFIGFQPLTSPWENFVQWWNSLPDLQQQLTVGLIGSLGFIGIYLRFFRKTH
jgi:hypothetical protein